MKVYMKDGEVIAWNKHELAEWISLNELEIVAGWGMQTKLPFKTVDMTLYDALDLLTPDARKRELACWMVDIEYDHPDVLDELAEMLEIEVAEDIPMEQREYRIEPYAEPWSVVGREIDDYYDEAESMEVGDVYANKAYRITRSKNARPAKGLKSRRGFRCGADATCAGRSSPKRTSSKTTTARGRAGSAPTT